MIDSQMSLSAMDHAVGLARAVCQRAGSFSLIDDVRRTLRRQGIAAAVRSHDTRKLFDWLIGMLSYQGISDRVAESYIDQHGSITHATVAGEVARSPSCPKLAGYWQFHDCGYRKWKSACNEPLHFMTCPLPLHRLRNGRLNQTAFSLYLFMRDIADGDFVQWVDGQIADDSLYSDGGSLTAARGRLLDPLRHIYGVSDKVLSMALSSLLIGGSGSRDHWVAIGSSFVVIDSLVHNFMHRTGILSRFAANHNYGPACYRPGGCADLIAQISGHIDAQAFNPNFPSVFPRFVQLAIWRYCAQGGLDICNGNRIQDRDRCDNRHCQIRNGCDRKILHKTREISRYKPLE